MASGKTYRMLLALVLIVTLGLVSWYAVQVVTRKPVIEHEVAGVIVTPDRIIPDRIEVRGRLALKVYIANASDREQVKVVLATPEPVTAEVKQGEAGLMVIEHSALRNLDGAIVRVDGVTGMQNAVFAVNSKKTPELFLTEPVVVMTAEGAAPRVIRVKKGSATTLYVTKTASDIPEDTFVCDEMAVNAPVKDGQLTKIPLKTDKTGEFVFTGTVTPDSRVVVQVVD